ncbi:metal-sensitive transcriptional regulator [Pseudoduganella sp. GCM10020061]|uniref:metal-sensitive transcriptional regulator n=1 Tax=Pseudoduganella sp. GCM10020061 TaxID=3317345 RepID=UPI0036307172
MSQIGDGPLTPEQKTDLQHRLARIEGQLRGIQKLIAIAAEPSDCDAAVQQMAAARKALERCFTQLVCATMVTQADNARDLDAAQETSRHMSQILDKYLG